MPMGWDRGGLGGSSRNTATDRNQPIRNTWLDQVTTIAVSIVDEVVEIVHRTFEAEVWTRWQTAADEKVCPICGPYAGRAWKAADGPQPPLHPNCRCQRVYAFTTWTIRE